MVVKNHKSIDVLCRGPGGGGTLGPRRAIGKEQCLSLELLGFAVLIIVTGIRPP